MTDGKSYMLKYLYFAGLVQTMLLYQPASQRLLMEALAGRPPPWTIVVGCDEMWAGNNLATSGRNTNVVSRSFLELSAQRLAKRAACSPVLVIQTEVQTRDGGEFSKIPCVLLGEMLFDELGGFRTSGC